MTRARQLGKLGNENVFSVNNDHLVGVNSTSPQNQFEVTGVVRAKNFEVAGISTFEQEIRVGTGITLNGTGGTGIISATYFYGDITNTTGGTAGLGTAASSSGFLKEIMYTNQILTLASGITTVSVPDSAITAFTRAAEISVESGAELVIDDGDELITDVLGIGTTGAKAVLSGSGGAVRADNFTNKAGSGAPNFPSGLTGTTGTFTGNVTIGGTLTYEDVTDIDSVGLITARDGLQVLGGIATVSGQSNLANVNVSGTLTAPTQGNTTVGFLTCSGFDSNTIMWEKVNVVANKLSADPNINLSSGMVHYFTTTETTTSTPNIQSTVGLNTQMSNGDAVTCTIVTTAAAAGYSTGILIDGVATSPVWNGGSDPSAGGSSGLDVYTFNIIKTASATYTVLGNVSNFA